MTDKPSAETQSIPSSVGPNTGPSNGVLNKSALSRTAKVLYELELSQRATKGPDGDTEVLKAAREIIEEEITE